MTHAPIAPFAVALALAAAAPACLDASRGASSEADAAVDASHAAAVAGPDAASAADLAAAEDAPGPDVAPPAPDPHADRCVSTGTLGFSLRGVGFDALEGKTLRAAAVQPTDEERVVVVRLTTTIVGGAFSVSCPRSLEPNSRYPAYALFVDADSDGRCGPEDLALDWLLYAWLYDVDVDIEPGAGTMGIPWQPVGDLESWGVPFCEAYGFDSPDE